MGEGCEREKQALSRYPSSGASRHLLPQGEKDNIQQALMSENEERPISHSILLKMLAAALLEIRATENLRLAQALADVFHNTPARIAREIDAEEILADIRMRAERHGQSPYIERLLSHMMAQS